MSWSRGRMDFRGFRKSSSGTTYGRSHHPFDKQEWLIKLESPNGESKVETLRVGIFSCGIVFQTVIYAKSFRRDRLKESLRRWRKSHWIRRYNHLKTHS
jgi:hypothetical protein